MRVKAWGLGRVGAVTPIVAVSLVALLGFVALAVDVGMVAVARTQCQNAADMAAMAGARTLNGDSSRNYNLSAVTTNVSTAAAANLVAGQTVQSSQITTSVGSYTYDYSQGLFVSSIPAGNSDIPNLVQATVTGGGSHSFARAFGFNTFSVKATATAVHRPRDVAVVLDLSRSMRFDTLLGVPYYGTRTASNNPESVFPLFGHYSATTSAALQGPTSGPSTVGAYSYGPANVTVDTDSGPAIVKDFYQNALGASNVAAFSPASDTYASNPDGDMPLYKSNTPANGFAKTVAEYTGSTSVNSTYESNGYDANRWNGSSWVFTTFKGYTLGPRYWGKTFFLWPPDPRSGKDWRGKFFYNAGTTTPVTDNTRLWDTSGNWRAPSSSTYKINYAAILAWIKTAPNPFPPRLRAGRILYYDAIPDTINTSSFPPTDLNQRFWKEYIDYVLGVWQNPSNGTYSVETDQTGYGDDFTWGTLKVSTKPSGRYMDYQDNPKRPKLHFWFGPMSMLDFLGNVSLGYEYYPGNCHESPNWECKLGIQAAMTDVETNHPNDFVALMYYNTPKTFSGDSGAFNRTRVPLGRNYQRLSDTLWFPPTTIDTPGTEIRLYDAANSDVPRAIYGTSMSSGLLLAFNQLSSNSSLRTYAPSPAPAGEAGGYGRKGSQRLIIFETDGVVNTPVSAPFVDLGPSNSYYQVRQPNEYPSNSNAAADDATYAIARQICAADSASPAGYSTTRKPVQIHCIAFGSIFESASAAANASAAQLQTDALTLLQNLQYIGNTQADPSTPLASYKICTGTPQQRIDKLRQAFSNIMQDGVQVSLIQ
ncbi:MAG: pilus assembly protein TadG-related protein [Isosphaeraceae bacterium]